MTKMIILWTMVFMFAKIEIVKIHMARHKTIARNTFYFTHYPLQTFPTWLSCQRIFSDLITIVWDISWMSSIDREIIHCNAETWKLEFWLHHKLWGYHGLGVAQVHMTQEGLPLKSVWCLSKKTPCRETLADRQLPKVNTWVELEVMEHCAAYLESKEE